MSKIFLLVALFSTSLFLFGCKSADADSIPIKTPESLQENRTVNFKGVTFSYNPKIFGEVKSEEVAEFRLENETDKPENVAPQHIRFFLKNQNREAMLAVYPIEDFRRVWASVEKNNTKIFGDQLSGLQKVIKDTNFRLNNEIPYIPFIDGSQMFQAKVNRGSFKNGKGIFFLTQYHFEHTIVNNKELKYYFQGITNDNKYYVLAVFDVEAAFLPKDSDALEFDDYKLPLSFGEKDEKPYKEYVQKITRRLEYLSSSEFEPHLKQIDELISTLKIVK